MALKGNLRDFSITQLLNLVNLAHKTGLLNLEAPGDTAQVSFREGKLAYARVGAEDNSLAAILHRAHKISNAQHKLLKDRAANMSDKELGLLLINAGYLTQADVLESLQQYFVDVVRRLFTWGEGFFSFEADGRLPEDRILVRMDLENLIMSHPSVLEAAVIGVPDPKWQERPVGCIVVKSGMTLTPDELKAFLKDKVKANWWIPQQFAFIDQIPKTSVGKFSKKELREMFAAGKMPLSG